MLIQILLRVLLDLLYTVCHLYCFKMFTYVSLECKVPIVSF